MADLATLQARLEEAEAALHKLSLGQATAAVTSDTGGVTYTQATLPGLRGYILQLKAEIGRLSGRPMRRHFNPGFR